MLEGWHPYKDLEGADGKKIKNWPIKTTNRTCRPSSFTGKHYPTEGFDCYSFVYCPNLNCSFTRRILCLKSIHVPMKMKDVNSNSMQWVCIYNESNDHTEKLLRRSCYSFSFTAWIWTKSFLKFHVYIPNTIIESFNSGHKLASFLLMLASSSRIYVTLQPGTLV